MDKAHTAPMHLSLSCTATAAQALTASSIHHTYLGHTLCGVAGGFNPQFFPKLAGIQTLFSRPATTASWVLHILAINLFLGRTIYLDGACWDCTLRMGT